jgi:DNA polymerase-3 subunit gamma/tau
MAMKVEAQFAAGAPQALPGGVVQAARWRQALEAALWQPRAGAPSDSGPAPAGPTGVDRSSAARAAVASPPQLPSHAEAVGRPTGSAAGQAPGSHSGSAQPAQPALTSPPVDVVPPTVALPTAPALPAPILPQAGPQAALSTADARPATPPPQRPAEPAPEWPLSAGRACVQGQQVSASLRDARLGEADADFLRRALERRLAGSGLTLGELLVNGRLIVDRHGRT